MKPDDLKEKLKEYHVRLEVPILNYTSQIYGNQFPGEFNVSGFHKEVQELTGKEKSFWGIDTCLRLKDKIDGFHSFLFEMGIFARSVDLQDDFREPFKDGRFRKFQEEVITRFMQLLKMFGVETNNLEATYLGSTNIGSSEGRDKTLNREYTFPEDKTAQKILNKFGVRCYPISSLANIDIHPVEGSLVGSRIEIACKGIEIATVVFNFFKMKEGKLIPINYVGGYAIGIERLISVLNERKDFLSSVPKYVNAFAILKTELPASETFILREDTLMILFGSEVLARVKEIEKLSKSQKELFRQFKKKFLESCKNIGIKKASINKLIDFYDNENPHNRS